ncbi:MAG: TIGR03663 family protein [Ignavibacteriae bacterium]|nr:TIGR03663 family protein [Ignavibacteriota bacterium]
MIVIFFALFLRLFDLNNRPFHTDEAVHAIKFGELLETGKYIYDPIEYHGPTLNYFSLISAKIFDEKILSDTNEVTLRIVPAIISVILIILLISIKSEMNKFLILLIGILISISPIFVFYSRYYIQESMLVTFSYSAIITFYKYFKSKKTLWIILSAIFCSLIFTTKETSIIIYFSGFASFIILNFFNKKLKSKFRINKNHLILFLIIFIIVSILFYSSFFTNPNGILDSLKTFTNYFGKAGNNTEHIQPWYYYFSFLLFTKNDLVIFTEIPLFIFYLIGIYFLFSKKYFLQNYFFRFIFWFSLIQAIVYIIIPYKTPWLALNFWIGFLFISSFGIYSSYLIISKKNQKTLIVSFIFLIVSHNIFQTYLTNFKFPYQLGNPFTYSQPTPDVISASENIIKVAESDSTNINIFVNVISKNNDYWPLPWYLRKIKNIAWNENVPNDIHHFEIIITTPDFEEEIINKLYSLPEPGKINLYVPLFNDYTTIRPNVEIIGIVRNSLHEKYLRTLNNHTK